MAGVFDSRKTLVRILMGLIMGLLGVGMLLYLVPQGPSTSEATPDAIAEVGGQTITVADIRAQLSQIEQRGQIPKQLEALYAQQILKQLVFQKELEYEAKRLGITVRSEEHTSELQSLAYLVCR